MFFRKALKICVAKKDLPCQAEEYTNLGEAFLTKKNMTLPSTIIYLV